MKRIKILGLIIMIILAVSTNFIQAQDAEISVKKVLTSLFDLSKSKSYDKAASLISYTGEDKTRNQKDSFNASNKEELNQVKRICKKISALIDLSSKQEHGKFETKKSGSSENYIIEMNFISGDQKLVTAFTFIKTDKGFLLAEIN